MMSEQDHSQQEGTNPADDLALEKELDNIENIEDVEVLKESNLKAREAIKQLTARAKKAEAEAQSLRGSQPKSEEPKPTPTQSNDKNTISAEDIEIKILKSQGVSEDEVNYLKKIASVNGGSLIDAQKDELYVSWKTRREENEKAEKAKLGASRGSGAVKKEPGFKTVGLTEEDHKRLWREKQNR